MSRNLSWAYTTSAPRLPAEQTPREQRLHVAPPVSNEIYIDAPPDNPIGHTIGLEEHLPIVANTQAQKLLSIRAALWVRRWTNLGGNNFESALRGLSRLIDPLLPRGDGY